MSILSQRDAFWSRIFELAKNNKNIIAVIADMGAPALDKFRVELASQYLDVGIAEQQAVALSTGLCLSGKKAFAYAIAPFIAMRCFEHIRVNLASMNLPVTLVGVGAGVSYDDSGPTHHAVDDLSILRILPNLRINNITDAVMARAFADISCEIGYPNYVRLDRKQMPDIYSPDDDFGLGLKVFAEPGSVCLVATGNMVHRALEVKKVLAQKGAQVGVVDIFTLPINSQALMDILAPVKQVITLEEHTLPGGLGSAVCEVMADNGMLKSVKRLGMNFNNGYCYKYGGRDAIQALYGLDTDNIVKTVASFL